MALITAANLLKLTAWEHAHIEDATMRHLVTTAAALGFVALALAPIGPVEAAEEDMTPHLLTAKELGAPDRSGEAPVVLRGSAVSPKPPAEIRPSAAGWQIVAGRRL